jgi:hypothetical protein
VTTHLVAEPVTTDLLLWVTYDDGSPDELAMRTAAGRATVISVAAPGARQHYGDVVEVDEAGNRPGQVVSRARHVATLEPGGFRSFRIVGAHPGNRPWATLQRQVHNRGWALWLSEDDTPVISGDAASDGDGDGQLTLRALLAVPEGTDPVEVDAVLHALTGDWAAPPAWPELAVASGADVARHRSVARAFGAEITLD